MKHLKPSTPDASMDRSVSGRCALSGTRPPHSPTSTQISPCIPMHLVMPQPRQDLPPGVVPGHTLAAHIFFSTRLGSVVAGLLFSGMSMIVVMPPAAAALVAVSMPGKHVSPHPCCKLRHSARCMQSSTFPVGAAGLVHVDMGVNEARRDDKIAIVQDAAQTRQQVCCVRKICQGSLPVNGPHGSNLAVLHAHCSHGMKRHEHQQSWTRAVICLPRTHTPAAGMTPSGVTTFRLTRTYSNCLRWPQLGLSM